MRELAVDFGTSNTVAAVRSSPGAAPSLLTFDGWPVLPSTVWLADDGSIVVGREAERQARLDPARYEPNPKQRIDDGQVLLGSTPVEVTELIAAVLGRVAAEAERQLGGPPETVVLTHPAGWRQTRRDALAHAARRAGWQCELRLVAEPVAAATHFTRSGAVGEPQVGQAIAVFDMGGGTTDIAVLQRTPAGWHLLAEAGIPDFGGRDVDHLLHEHVRTTLSREHAESTTELWDELRRPSTPAMRRSSRTLADDIRAGKEALSSYPQTDIPLPPPLPDAHVTRRELEDLVRPGLERSITLLATTVAGVDLRAVFLVGGATRMPLVAQLINERVGVLPVAVDSPECSVALGAGNVADADDTRQLTAPMPFPPTTPQSFPAYPGQQAVHQPTPPQPFPAQRTWQTPPAKRPKWPYTVAAAAVLVVAATVTAVTVASSSGEERLGGQPSPSPSSSARPSTSTGPTSSSARVTTTEPKPDNSLAFGNDMELLGFAGGAVDRALGCVNAIGTSGIGDTVGARSHVRCQYRGTDGADYFANFLSGDTQEACEAYTQMLHAEPGSKWSDPMFWRGGGLFEITSDGPRATIYWQYSTGTPCGFFGPREDAQVPVLDLHRQWNASVGLEI
ncbi:molecular chaperone Hsp70 [Amycolatopsis antarctica]|uniref:Molecular chaperone Hsp70 n=1 Tax=Amycolatopsis antarctica TaxID=1854586 RepID=A0A263D3F8_9PSEU|nr:Hsp70 family protein [Amycolatopsis antarctica]OZM72749.1 molecular chaperone Hsp70 [Amycolatopsis antarctica]